MAQQLVDGKAQTKFDRREYPRRQPGCPILGRFGTGDEHRYFEVENISEKGFLIKTTFTSPLGTYANVTMIFPGNTQALLSVRIMRRRAVSMEPLIYELGVMVMDRHDASKYREFVSALEPRIPSERRHAVRREVLKEENQDSERRRNTRRGIGVIAQRIAAEGIGLDRWGSHYTYERVLQSSCDRRVKTQGRSKLMLGSNSYLGLTGHPRVMEGAIRAIEQYGTGAGGVRVLSGTMTLHRELEEKLAVFKGSEACLILPSGYMANYAVLSTMLQKGDVVFCDARNHASIVDGCRASGATMRFYHHNDMNSLEKKLKQYDEKRGKLVVTDGVFSMDGDAAPVKEFLDVCRYYGAMSYVDDAHGTGVLGAQGRGTAEFCGVFGKVDITVATLSKALGAIGGAVCGTKAIVKHITHHARSFIFSSALPPSVCGAVLAALDVIKTEPQLLFNLTRNRDLLVKELRELGYNVPETFSAIIPVIIGDEEKTYRLANLLDEMNVFVNAVSAPAVPRELSRLRVSVMATHTLEDLGEAVNAFKNAGRILGII